MLQKLGVDVYPAMSPEEFQKFVDSELARWGGVIRSANIKAD
jgi:tripartite-type tricarboxylate transporter receptor subunit TctC